MSSQRNPFAPEHTEHERDGRNGRWTEEAARAVSLRPLGRAGRPSETEEKTPTPKQGQRQ